MILGSCSFVARKSTSCLEHPPWSSTRQQRRRSFAGFFSFGAQQRSANNLLHIVLPSLEEAFDFRQNHSRLKTHCAFIVRRPWFGIENWHSISSAIAKHCQVRNMFDLRSTTCELAWRSFFCHISWPFFQQVWLGLDILWLVMGIVFER